MTFRAQGAPPCYHIIIYQMKHTTCCYLAVKIMVILNLKAKKFLLYPYFLMSEIPTLPYFFMSEIPTLPYFFMSEIPTLPYF
jgi:hypothetical protein